MSVSANKNVHKSRSVKPWVYAAALLVNVIVFIFIGAVYVLSQRYYSDKLFNENINNVNNLNISLANAAYTYTNSMGVKVDDIVSYVESADMDIDEAVEYLAKSSTNADWQYQLVHSGNFLTTGELSFGDYTGVSIRKVISDDGELDTLITNISYTSGYYDIFKSFTDADDMNYRGVCFVPEFTDPDTKQKCFAVYRHTVMENASGERTLYTLLLAVNSETALNTYNLQREYDGQSNVLVNADGDYIIKSSDFRNANFYDYIVNYNGLKLDMRNQIKQDIVTRTGEIGACSDLFYRNHQGADCVFSVCAVENGWYSITCVPLSSFDLEESNTDYALIILVVCVLLFALDGLAIRLVWKRMRDNVAVAEKATKEATEANRAKSRFLSTMSHELRTPLNAIIGLVSLCSDSLNDTQVIKSYLRKIDISSKLLLQLISDILDVSAIESDKMTLNCGELDLTRLITSLSAIYYDQCTAKGIEFSVVVKNLHSEHLTGDSVRVNQVLLNFLSNAVKFTPSGGKVTLMAEQTERLGETVVIRFTVSDTGCGISSEMSTRLFKPFERATGDASRRYSGTGLGLSIAKKLVELMDGNVGFVSTEGEGTSFYAEIPFGLLPESEKKIYSPIKNLRVIAAVSDPDEREYIGQILKGLGVERTLTTDAQSAMELLRERASSDKAFNLCILDWMMHDLSGLDASKQIRAQFDEKSLRIIVLAYNLAQASPQCTSFGADVVFGKPVFPSALYNTLAELTGGSISSVPEPKGEYALNGKRVLLVEDNALNIEIASMLLARVGIEVETAENGLLGYERFCASEPGHFDAVLMDVQMPVMDGYQSTAAIRKSGHPQAKSIPILAMTADAFTDDVLKAHESGMDEHISKPVVPEILYEVLKNYIC